MAKDQNAVDIRKGNCKLALGLWGRTVLSAVMSFFVLLSVTAVFTGVGTSEKGYELYRKEADGTMTLVERHLYAEEEASSGGTTTTTQAGETSETDQTTTTTEGLYRVDLRTELSPGVTVARDVVLSLLTLSLLAIFPYSVLWTQGDKDKNSVQFGHMAEDKLRGLKVGFLSAIPSAIAYAVLILSKLGVAWPNFYSIYRFANAAFLPIFDRLTGSSSVQSAELSWGVIAAMLMAVLFVPLVAQIGYTLGYKQISLMERFIYVNPKKRRK